MKIPLTLFRFLQQNKTSILVFGTFTHTDHAQVSVCMYFNSLSVLTPAFCILPPFCLELLKRFR